MSQNSPPDPEKRLGHKTRDPNPKKGSVTKLATPTSKKARSQNSRPQLRKKARSQKVTKLVRFEVSVSFSFKLLHIQSRNIMPRSKPPKYCPTCTEIFSQPTCSRHCKGPQMCRMHGYKKLVLSKARPNLAAVGSRAFLSRAFICRRLQKRDARQNEPRPDAVGTI